MCLYVTHWLPRLSHIAEKAIKAPFVKTVKPNIIYKDVTIAQWLARGAHNAKAAGLNLGMEKLFW